MWNCELSSIDTSLLSAASDGFASTSMTQIQELATAIYERVDWRGCEWGDTFSMGWKPGFGGGFCLALEQYCELMMIYLLAIGSLASVRRYLEGVESAT